MIFQNLVVRLWFSLRSNFVYIISYFIRSSSLTIPPPFIQDVDILFYLQIVFTLILVLCFLYIWLLFWYISSQSSRLSTLVMDHICSTAPAFISYTLCILSLLWLISCTNIFIITTWFGFHHSVMSLICTNSGSMSLVWSRVPSLGDASYIFF